MVMTFKERAEMMILRGVRVVPARPGMKFSTLEGWPQLATTDPDQITRWNVENRESNCVSVPTLDTVWILDVDNLKALEKLPHELPPTLKVSTPSGGMHAYFEQTAKSVEMGNRDVMRIGDYEVVSLNGRPEPLLEAKINKKSAASPGSTTEKGVYSVIDDSLLIPAPDWLIDFIIQNSKRHDDNLAASKKSRRLHPDFDPDDFYAHYEEQRAFSIVQNIEKNGFWVDIPSCGCVLKGNFHEQSGLTGFLRSNDSFGYNCFAAGCDDPTLIDVIDHLEEEGYERYPGYIYLDEDEELLAERAGFVVEDVEPESDPDTTSSTEVVQDESDTLPHPTDSFNYRWTDTGNAERLVRKFGNKIRYVRDLGLWRVWDGQAWAPDRTGKVERSCKKVAQELFNEAALIQDKDERKAALSWAKHSENRSGRNSMVELASKEKTIVTLAEDYDKDDWLFNCQNGTIDLKTGELRPHDPADMMSKISPVSFDPAAECSQWEKFLRRVQADDQQMIDFLARAVGYSLSGDTSLQAMLFLHGDGCNGKGVLTTLIRRMMGTYGDNASFDTFIVKKNGSQTRNDLAMLVGARFVTASESGDGHLLDEALIKTLTGQDPITVRLLYKEFFTFTPKFKLWMSSNYKPRIRGLDWGIWRRVKLIPFDVTIPDGERDEQLGEKLQSELPGILNWALKGLRSYLLFGMMYPEKVNMATQQYRDSQDIVGQFLQDKCIVCPDATVKQKSLFEIYKAWAESNNEYLLKESQFSEAVRRHGYPTEHKKDGNHYIGLGLAGSAASDASRPAFSDEDILRLREF
jgi:putative DNA primase/helicase